MSMWPGDESDRRRRQRWGLRAVVIALIALGPIDAFQTYLLSIALGQPTSWQTMTVRLTTMWLIYPLLIPLAFFLARRFPLDLPTWRRSLVVHFATILLLATVHSLIVGVVIPLIPSDPIRRANLRMPFRAELVRFMRIQLPTDFLAYGALVGFFYASQYYSDREEWELTAAQLQASLSEARLRTLQSQLNPHFLFNTLNAVSVLAMKGEQRAVVDMLARLSDLLRVALDETRPQQVPLEAELAFVDRYLDIQRIRFGDRLSIHQDVAPEALSALVPSMLLQPLVENAIKYGISTECGPGSVGIHVARSNGTLELRVTDSGPGFQSTTPGARPNGIGLRNTEARLAQLYGSAQHVEYSHAPGGGASVTISMPFLQEPPDDAPLKNGAAL
jgi:two-component system LytT family sensor kinase